LRSTVRQKAPRHESTPVKLHVTRRADLLVQYRVRLFVRSNKHSNVSTKRLRHGAGRNWPHCRNFPILPRHHFSAMARSPRNVKMWRRFLLSRHEKEFPQSTQARPSRKTLLSRAIVSRRSRPAPALRTDGCPTERKVLRFRRCKAVASVGPRNCGQLSSSPSKYCRTQMRLCGEGRVSAPGRI
jgi:hypothetical protein